MKIIPDSRIRNIVSKGPKYRFPSHIDFNRCREEIASAFNDFGNRWCNRESIECNALKEWKLSIFNIVDKRIKFFSHNTNLLPPKPKSSFRHLKQGIQEFHGKNVLVPADKAVNNIVVVCRLSTCFHFVVPYLLNTLKPELNGTKAYKETSTDEKLLTSCLAAVKSRVIIGTMRQCMKGQGKIVFSIRNCTDHTPLLNVFSALKGTHFYILFVVTAAGVVLCGSPKKQPRTSSIVQFIFFVLVL